MAAPSGSSKKIKFHHSYGGTFKVCPNDGKLKYIGGINKIMTVDQTITYTELIVKMWDICGPSMNLRCKLPRDDFYLLVQVTSDKDLNYVMEEYERVGKDMKIRAILDPLPPPITEVVDDYFRSKVASMKFFDYTPSQFYHIDQAVDGFLSRKIEECSFY
ncbi:unnamed protein product [Lactuca virosa]|uniref:PB1 domain-containing protein n=1 Tax=Lactuca virosa TaxID=75947 RepID=A0AAU9MIL3_9ASTR|nr:unnamed protein product [Lactuca virosa]